MQCTVHVSGVLSVHFHSPIHSAVIYMQCIYFRMKQGGTQIFYWSSAFRICTGCLPKYEWDFQIFQHPAKFGSILAKKGHFLNFLKRVKTSFFSTPETKQKLGNSHARFLGKNAKTSIFGHFRPKRAILEVFGQNGQNGENYQKTLGIFISHLQALTN